MPREQTTTLNKQLRGFTVVTPSSWWGIKADSEETHAAMNDGWAAARRWARDRITP